MSSENRDGEGDLIDFHVRSPILLRVSPIPVQEENCNDNLIDTELPILEQKLQTASNNNILLTDSRRTSVDIEDILITIDDDEQINFKTIQRSNSEEFSLDSSPERERNNLFKSLSCDNIEALIVLKNLDDVLNATLLQSNKILNEDDNVPDEQTVEDCLLDLDNYLKALDSSGCDDNSNESYSSVCIEDQPSTRSSTSSLEYAGNQSLTDALESTSEENDESLRNKLRQMEVNYTKFLASGCVNRGYIDTENNNELIRTENDLRRPLSACDMHTEALSRNHPTRATVAVIRRERPALKQTIVRKSLDNSNNNNNYPTRGYKLNRTSGNAAADSDEDIDWSWVHDVARDVTLERRAHAAGDRCTGTVVVEPPHRPVKPSSSTSEVVMTDDPKEDVRCSSIWLRNSMRRLRHFRLPSDAAGSENIQSTSNPVEDVVPTRVETLTTTTMGTTNMARPVSAPSRLPPSVSVSRTSTQRSRSRSRNSRNSVVSHVPGGRARSSSASSRSRRPRSLSSSESSLASSVDSTPSCTPTATPTHNNQEQATTNSAIPRRPCERSRQNDMPEADSPLGQWPHSLSSMMACLGCTLGLFNISRFAILTIHFGANFIFQFFFLSLLFGLPLFTLQLCLGQQLGAGVVDMWRISPLFQGVGVSLLLAQALMGLYSIVGVSWMFVFFRDSFITKFDKYRWAEPFLYYRNNLLSPMNSTYKLSETVPDYFSGIVLQRQHLATGNAYGTIKFQLAFNLAVVWMIVFVSLSKGLRSYGKVVYAFTLLPVFGTFVLCAKILGLMPPEYVNIIFPETSWAEFFLNPKSWMAAAQEVFLTWGLLGAAVMQIASHNKHKHLLQRDSSLVAVITFTILLFVAFLANTCVQILKSYGYNYVPNSFEKIPYFSFLRPIDDPLPPNLANTPVRYMSHSSFILGEKVTIPGVDPSAESGYQVLRFATELIPATFAVIGSDQVSPFWAVLFYFILIMFGIAQQLAIWHCVITGIMAIKAKVLKSWETTITFFSCACGFILGLPMATELGIYVVYFMDYTVGGIWWLVLVILLQIVAVFMVRGRPYSGDTVVTALFNQNNHPCLLSWQPALLSFTWNVILPVGLMVLCISTFNNGKYSKELFTWHQHYSIVEKYFPLPARQVGSLLQLLPILCVPIVALIQSYRYLNNGPSDILDRIQLLYRPPIGEHMEEITVQETTAATGTNTTPNTTATISNEDPPPKYTPPPSYTTATGARIAKFLRQSIRRSVRRLANVLGESSTSRQRAALTTTPTPSQPPPPDYNTVLVEMNNTPPGANSDIAINVTDSSGTPNRLSTLERLRNLGPSSSALTAAEVASILRSSFRRSTIRPSTNIRNTNFSDNSITSLSAENLVDSAAPIGETSLVLDHMPATHFDNEENKSQNDNLSSVI